MKRLIGLVILLLICVGSLFAQEEFPMGWHGAYINGRTSDFFNAVESTHVMIFTECWANSFNATVAALLQAHPEFKTNVSCPWGSGWEYGGYLSETIANVENYPTQWDYDSLSMWQDLNDMLVDKLVEEASDLNAYCYFATYFDWNTQQLRIRKYPGIHYMVNSLKSKDPTRKCFNYYKQMGDTLDNHDGKGIDFTTSIFFAFLKSEPTPDEPGFYNYYFQNRLGRRGLDANQRFDGQQIFIEVVEHNCREADKYAMEYWPRLHIDLTRDAGGIRYPTRAELWAEVNLALLYGSKGFTFYHLVGDFQTYGVFNPATSEPIEPIYSDMCEIGDKLSTVGPVFRSLKYRDARSVQQTATLQNYFYINEISAYSYSGLSSSDIYYEVGIFTDPVEGYRYFMVVNRNCRSQDSTNYTIKLKLPQGTYNLRNMYNGWFVGVNLQTDANGLIQFTNKLQPGNAGLYKVEPIVQQAVNVLQVDNNYLGATSACNGRKIAVDKLGRIHICYTNEYPSGHYEVWYAVSNDGGVSWIKQRVASEAKYPSIAIDRDGYPYIIYRWLNNAVYYLMLWSEAGVTTLMEKSFEPGVFDVDTTNGIGVAYSNSWLGYYFREAQIRLLDHHSLGYVQDDAGTRTNFSCCVTKTGDIVCVANDENKNLIRRLSGNPSCITRYTGVYSLPNLSTQGEQLWVTYFDNTIGGLGNVKLKVASPPKWVISTSSTNICSNQRVLNLQMANNYPFLVIEEWDSQSNSKIWYSFKTSNAGWTSLQRVTTSGNGFDEHFPHVFVSEAEHTVYVTYTETSSSGSFVRVQPITFDELEGSNWENLFVIKPSCGETWRVGDSKFISWYSSTNPHHFVISYRENDNAAWRIVEGASSVAGTYRDFKWVYVGKDDNGHYIPQTSSTCKIRIQACASDNTVLDSTISMPFKISSSWITGSIYVSGYTPFGVKTGGGSRTDPGGGAESIMSLGNKNTNPEGPAPSEEYLGYLQPTTQTPISWQARSLNSMDTIILKFSSDDGKTYTKVCGCLPIDSALVDTSFSGSDTLYLFDYFGGIDWTTPSQPTSGGYIQLMAWDTTSDTFYSAEAGRIKIVPPGGNKFATAYNQRIIGEGKAAGQIGITYQGPVQTVNGATIYYLNSNEGLSFDTPDTFPQSGYSPSQVSGCVTWLNPRRDTIKYSNWRTNLQAFSSPVDLITAVPSPALYTRYSAPAIVNTGTINYVFAIRKVITLVTYPNVYRTDYGLVYKTFSKDNPGSGTSQSGTFYTASGVDTTTPEPISAVIQGSNLLMGYSMLGSCYYLKTSGSITTPSLIGSGFSPSVSATEGNRYYSYLSADSGSVIRLWGYRDDTVWIERDTFPLDTTISYSCIAEDKGLLYSAQRVDSGVVDLYIYDAMNNNLSLRTSYAGYYGHPYIDAPSSNELSWVLPYADEVDPETYYFTTDRRGLGIVMPALYLESRTQASSFTLYRDGCIHYASEDIDSASDTLKYRFPYLDSDLNYSLILEFYTECTDSTTLEITVGSEVDTLQIPGQAYSWFNSDIPSLTDTLQVKIKRISATGFVPVSRVIVWRNNESESYILGNSAGIGPEKIVFCLFQPNPNPFSDAATIRYSLPYATNVSLKVYDISGRLVNTLVEDKVEPGVHSIRWEGKDNANRKCPSGVYFVRFTAADYRASKKMVLIK